jgi:hypothetical protein
VNAGTVAANVLWAVANRGSARRFAAALREPEEAQATWLRARLVKDAASVFGREHGFGGISNYAEFTRRVPLRSWDEFAPWVERVRDGETNVLGMERVTHLAPTSGSSGARKLIPFTAGLQAGFSAAVGAWMMDLARTRPGLLGGPSYWSVSPLVEDDHKDGKVRVGFADDAEYLGGVRAWLVRRALAVPAELRHERDMEVFWRRTLTCLLARRDLRMISVWHPSFLELLLAAAERHWEGVCGEMNDATRGAELKVLGPKAWARWWPGLRVISCWGDQAAEAGCRELRRKFPGVLVQAKGLLATEAAVTIPWRGDYPLAVTSHFFEFIDGAGGVRRAHELEQGENYEVVVTNGGGLWCYRLGDIVECTGRVAVTPTLRFLGRAGNVSDLCGEKLSEAFVAEVLNRLWAREGQPGFLVLAATTTPTGQAGYTLYSELGDGSMRTEELEGMLKENPHYAWARRLGQLAEAKVRRVPAGVSRHYLNAKERDGSRLGDVKVPALIRRDVEVRWLEAWAREAAERGDCVEGRGC